LAFLVILILKINWATTQGFLPSLEKKYEKEAKLV